MCQYWNKLIQIGFGGNPREVQRASRFEIKVLSVGAGVLADTFSMTKYW
jgi:hypothetical protein